MKQSNHFFICTACLCVLLMSPATGYSEEQEDYRILREIVQNEFQKEVPAEQGTDLGGVVRRFETTDKKVAIVLEACLDTGAELDAVMFKKLEEKKIPVSLFSDQGWLQKNSEKIKAMLVSGNVHLENHGAFCRPLSVTGKGVKNHPGTSGVDEVFEEVEKNARGIEQFTGRLPLFFKSGYGFYDDIALKIVTVLGYAAVEGDLKLRSKDVETDAALREFLNQIRPGSIIVIPANRPGTAGVWMPKMLNEISRQGYAPVALDDVLNIIDENR